MLISVITVCRNAADLLDRTIRSVMSQDFRDMEYIVVDGASTDGSSDVIRRYSGSIDKWISEPDKGIYEAMNKGVRMAAGEYCIFMNAGDRFVSSHVLSRISPYLKVDWVLGNQMNISEEGRIRAFVPSIGAITERNLLQSSISHQASFIRRQMLLDEPYDESLRLVSDWKFALKKLILDKCSYNTVDVDICFFLYGGSTSRFRELGKEERRKVADELLTDERLRRIASEPYRPTIPAMIRVKLKYYIKCIRYCL